MDEIVFDDVQKWFYQNFFFDVKKPTDDQIRKHLGGADNKESTFFAECLQLYEQTLKKDVSSIESCHDRLSTLLDGNIGNKNSNPFSIFDGEAACK